MPRPPGRKGRRPVWSGTLAFGLVTLPVELHATVRPSGGGLRMVTSEGAPLSRRYVGEENGELLKQEDIVRGYEVDEDEFVLVEDEELDALDPEHSRIISLDAFVPAEEIDPVLVARSYVLVPQEAAVPAYRLLVAAMAESDRAGIATFVMRERAYLLAIVSVSGTLRALTLRYHDEIRDPADMGLPQPETAGVDDIRELEQAIGKLEADGPEEGFLKDTAAARMERLVRRKLKRKSDVHELPAAAREDQDAEPEPGDVLELLRQSLEQESAP